MFRPRTVFHLDAPPPKALFRPLSFRVGRGPPTRAREGLAWRVASTKHHNNRSVSTTKGAGSRLVICTGWQVLLPAGIKPRAHLSGTCAASEASETAPGAIMLSPVNAPRAHCAMSWSPRTGSIPAGSSVSAIRPAPWVRPGPAPAGRGRSPATTVKACGRTPSISPA